MKRVSSGMNVEFLAFARIISTWVFAAATVIRFGETNLVNIIWYSAIDFIRESPAREERMWKEIPGAINIFQ